MLRWDDIGEHSYEAGVDRGVFYPSVGPGIPWNGLVSVAESEQNTQQRVTYVDGHRQVTVLTFGDFIADLSAFTYPPEFEAYDGTSKWESAAQDRPDFNLSYRTLIGDDVEDLGSGYQIHLVYNAKASPSHKNRKSLVNAVAVETFLWGLTTTPVIVPRFRPCSHFIIDTTKAYPETIGLLEDMLYGFDGSDARFPTIDELLDLFESTAIFQVTDNGDGTATITGPDEAVEELEDGDLVRLTWPSVIQLSEDTYQLSSL